MADGWGRAIWLTIGAFVAAVALAHADGDNPTPAPATGGWVIHSQHRDADGNRTVTCARAGDLPALDNGADVPTRTVPLPKISLGGYDRGDRCPNPRTDPTP